MTVLVYPSKTDSILLTGASATFAVRMVGALIMFGVQVLLARVMELDSYGYYVYLLAWIMIFGQFSMLGFDTSLVRYTASYLAMEKFKELRGVITVGFLLPTMVNLIAITIVLSIMYYFRKSLHIADEPAMLSAFLLLPVFSVNGIRQAVLRGLKHVVKATFPDQVIRPSLIVVGILIIYGYKRNLTASDALQIHVFSAVIAMFIGGLALRKLIPTPVRTASAIYQTSKWINSSLPLLLMSVMTLIINQSDIVMLGMLTDSGSTGRFAVAARVSEIVSFGLVAINTIAAPLIAEHYTRKDRKQLVGVVEFSALASFLYIILACGILILNGKFILSIFGTAYTVAYSSLMILLVGQFVNSLAGSVGNLLTMTGRQNVVAGYLSGITLLNIALNYILIPQYGIDGAATATALSVVVFNILLFISVYQHLEINPTIFGYVSRRIFDRT